MKKTSDVFNVFGIPRKKAEEPIKKKKKKVEEEPIKKKKKKKLAEDDVPIKKKKKKVLEEDEPVKKKKKKKKLDAGADSPKKSKGVEAPFVITDSKTLSTKSSKKEQKYGKLMTDLFPDFSTEEHYELAAAYRKRLNKHTPELGLGSISDMYDIDPNSGLAVPKDKELILPDSFDVRAMMRDATDPVTGVVRDLKIDDRDLALAKNYYDFSFRIIGKDAHPPWARQMWTGLMLFGEVCPCCSNPKFLDIHNVDKKMPAKDLAGDLVMLEHGVCPKCKRNKWELHKKHGLKLYQQLVNLLGQRGGKSSSAAGYAAYDTHRFLKFPNLAQMSTGMQASTELTATFVSLSLSKAIGVLWTPFRKMIEGSRWFKEYFALLDHYKEKYGKELYRDSTLYLKVFHKNLHFYPSGPRASTLRGDTRILALLDELGLFPLPKGDEEEDETSERANADEAHKSLTNSLVTVQGVSLKLLEEGQYSVPPALMMSVSSPASQRDKMMRLLRESRTDVGREYILGLQLPTWEANPTIDEDNPIIRMAYNSNPEKAERDFGANPPMVHSTYIKRNLVEHGIFVNGQNSHIIKYQLDRPGELYAKIEKVRTVRWPSLLTIDAGHVNNSFTITAGHFDFKEQKTVVSTVLECMPMEGRKINFNLMYQHVILPLAKDVNAIGLVADQWQGLDLLYRLAEDMGMNPLQKPRVKSVQYSPRRKDFNALYAMLEAKNMLLPTVIAEFANRIFDGQIENWRVDMLNHPIEHLLLQMLTVKEEAEGRPPVKGDGFTDDIFRSLVLLTKIHDPKVMERLKEARDWTYDGKGNRNKMPLPAFAGRSGGFSTAGMRRMF